MAEKLPCGRPAPGPVKRSGGNQVSRYWALFEEYSRAQKLNFSESRKKIVEMALRQGEHFTTSDFVKRVGKAHPSVGPATIYRNLPHLVAAGILRESLSDESGQIVYELQSSAHHDHVVCLDCQAIFEFHDEQIESLQKKAMGKLRFSEERHRHVIYARCLYRKPEK
jgi:Fur family transcriptional regulator, ferric uptake regulator